jgi:hypothetical protein
VPGTRRTVEDEFDVEEEVEAVILAVAARTRDQAAVAAEQGRDWLASILRAVADELDPAGAILR